MNQSETPVIFVLFGAADFAWYTPERGRHADA